MNTEEKKQILCVASRLLGSERQNTQHKWRSVFPNSQVESFIKAKRGWKQFGQTWLCRSQMKSQTMWKNMQVVIMGIVHVKRSPQAVTSMIKRFLEEYDKQVSLQKLMLSATVRKFRIVSKEGNRMITRNMDYSAITLMGTSPEVILSRVE